MDSNQTESRSEPSPARVALLGALLLVVLGGLFLFGFLRHRRIETVAAEAAEREVTSIPVVNVAHVRKSPPNNNLVLPGNITPLTEAYIYARASGYVSKRYVDIGDHVNQNQLMAEIEAPDLDQQVAQARAAVQQSEQQLQQARAQLDTAKTQLELARVTWDRYQVLVKDGAIARQDADNQLTAFRSAASTVTASEANVNAAEHNVGANRANLDRLITLQGFENVRAPFTGIVTARNFDIGALISGAGGTQGGSIITPAGGTQASGAAGNAGTSGASSLVSPSGGGAGGGAGTELFRVAQIRVLRILINVPQENAPTVAVGQPATVYVQEFPNHPFPGKVTRTANAVDPNSRTLLTEVQVKNPTGILLPGMYTQVELTNALVSPPLLVPGDSIITTAKGLQVAILGNLPPNARDQQGREYPPTARRVHIQNVEVGRDYGQVIEITRGLQGWEYVIVNPSDVVEEGAVVQPQAAAPPALHNATPKGPAKGPNHAK